MYIDKENSSIFLIQKLNNIKQTLNSDPINLSNLKREFESFEKFKQEENYNYLENLLDPINRKGVKIPSKTPVATCSFQLKNNFVVETNNGGFAEIILNPWFLYTDEAIGKAFTLTRENGSFVNFVFRNEMSSCIVISNGSNITGESPPPATSVFTRLFVGQRLPADIYSSFRLVSACLEAKYVGQINEAQGLMGGAILQEKINTFSAAIRNSGGGNSSTRVLLNQYASLATIRNCFYSTEVSCLEGLRLLYFPMDNSYLEFRNPFRGEGYTAKFQNVDIYEYVLMELSPQIYQKGFNFVVYLFGGQPRKKILDITIYFNFECTVSHKFLNYVPVSINVWKIPKWTMSELAKTMEKHAVTAIKKMSGIDFFIA